MEIDWNVSRFVPTAPADGARPGFMLVARVVESPTKVSLGDVLSLLAGRELHTLSQVPTLAGYTAEAVFEALERRTLIFGFQATRAGFILRRELHYLNALIASYDSTDRQQRELRFWPRQAASHLRSQLEREASALAAKDWIIQRFLPKSVIAEVPGVGENG